MESEINQDKSVYDDAALTAALHAFGITYLYPWQRLVIANILDASQYSTQIKTEDTAYSGHQIVLLPTGAGKSLCFLIPAVLLRGPTLVIYPLLALMTDQQRRIKEAGFKSVTFKGNQSPEEREENFRQIKAGTKIILANPEVLQNEKLVTCLALCGIVQAVIDEAHCISEWGDSFRPAYLTVGKILKKLQVPVITAFTATASSSVLNRIAEVLFNGEAHIVRSEGDRPNISYYVEHTYTKKQEVLKLAVTERRPMIIFCSTRANAEDIARELTVCYGRETARFYHAGLEKKEKDETEKWFFNGTNGILCATCAYGMGVDKHDIRTVIHFDPPATAEAYIQESGRAGRDGLPAKAILLWSPEDSAHFASFQKGSREYIMNEFAGTKDCRRQVLLDALGAEQAVCSGCDLCNMRRKMLQGKKKWKKTSENTGQFVLNFISRYKKRYTNVELENILLPLLNKKSRAVCGRNIWEHRSITEMMYQLEKAGKIRTCSWPWKSKVTIAGKIIFQKQHLFRILGKNRSVYSLQSRLKAIPFLHYLLRPRGQV
ncbi:MAG: RecQ family ATP-dependent DNA helicase [Treponema sp.]|nr:RecQ family ATP-dependent DNA helicase [Treponema sp.]